MEQGVRIYCIHSNSLIIGEDLNLTMSREEIWGSCSREYVLAKLFPQ